MKFDLSPIVFLLVGLWPVLTPHARGAVRTWLGSNGAWENNNNWSGTLQPFDPDTAIIGAGRPVISFVEGIAALQVGAGAGIDQGGALSVHGSVQNDGQISVLTNGQFQIDAGALSGDGEVVLTDSVGTYATINGASHPNPCCVTHAATHVIRGEGAVAGKWINNGLIRAEETSGDSTATLHLIGQMTNNGVIRSSATGAVSLEGMLTVGAAGQVIADQSPIILVGTANVTGGVLQATNGAKIVKDATGGATLSGVTLNADLDVIVTNGGVIGLGTGITNNGTITVDNSGVANGELSMAAGTTLDGTGTLVLNRANTGTKLTGNFTHGASHTIRGAGVIQATMVNNGAMFAEPKTGGGLLRFINNALTNNNLVQANSGGVFRFEQEAAINQGTGGRIRAANGGTVELMNNATVTGGKLQTDGTGVITTPVSNASVLVDVSNEGNFQTAAGATTRVRGAALANIGAMIINPTGANALTTLEFGSSITISGTGSILLNQAGNAARIAFASGSEIVTQSAGHAIRGRGTIDNGFGSGRFVNHGRLEGNSAVEPLAIFTKLSGDGTLKDVAIGGGFVQILHILGEAGTTAIVPVEGSYQFGRNSSMVFDLAGTTPGSGYDQLNSTGPISLSATATVLDVSLAGGFLPLPGQTFTLLTTTDSLTGNFGTVNLPAVPLGLSWIKTQTANSLSITLVGNLAADFNDDLRVSNLDLAIWKAEFGVGTLHSQGDANGDGNVDGNDLLVWQRSLGWGVPASAVADAVPEPSSLALAAALLSVAIRRR